MKSIVVRLIACVFIFFGGLFLYGGVRNLWIGNASKSWPTVPGKVVSSIVDSRQRHERSSKHRSSRDVTNYYAQVVYEYTVNGKTRSSNDIAFGGYSLSKDPSQASGIVDKYPAGSQVVVYYSPAHPSMAVLEPGIRENSYIIPIFGAFSFGMGIIAFVQLPKSLQRQRAARASFTIEMS